MHSPDLSVEDDDKRKSLDKMMEFLSIVQCSVKETFDDTSDCENAIANIREVSYSIADFTYYLLFFC